MPFTVFHIGPGIAIKAVLQGSFSLMVFGWAQIIMDLQPLLVLITGAGRLHGFSHTWVGASLLTMVSALTGKYLSGLGLHILNMDQRGTTRIAWWVTVLSAAIGCYSHIILDSIMHIDMAPYYPFSRGNHLLGLLSVPMLHKFCVYSGLVGAAVYFAVRYIECKRHRHPFTLI